VAAANPGGNLNALMDENRRDPLSGNAVLSGVEVKMTPVAARVFAGQGVSNSWERHPASAEIGEAKNLDQS
jgi:hypothetical protein